MTGKPGEIFYVNRKWVLLSVVLGGLMLRFYKLDFQSLWYDELHSILSTNTNQTLSSIWEYCKSDQPPAHFYLLHFIFKFFPYTSFTGKAVSALLGMLSIPVMYLLGKECRDELTGLVAACFVSVNYFHVYYSQELRFYSMTFLFAALSYLFFIRSFKEANWRNFAGYAASAVILLYTHYYGLVVVAVQALTFLILLQRSKAFMIGGLVSGAIVAISFAPWLPVIFRDLGITDFWTKKPTPWFVLDYLYTYFGKDMLVTLIFAFLFFFFLKNFRKRQVDQQQKTIFIILLAWLIMTYLVPYARSVLSTPILHVRYTIISLPLWFILFAIGWSFLPDRKSKYILVIIVLLSSTVNLFVFRKHYQKVAKQQFREAAELIKLRNTSYEPVLSDYYWHVNFYFRDQPYEVQNVLGTDLTTTTSFWFVYIDFNRPEELSRHLHSFSAFRVTERHSFYQAEVFKLEKKSD